MDCEVNEVEGGPHIIPARTEWAPCLSAIAIAAKAHWGYPASWLYSWRNMLTISSEAIRESSAFVYISNHRILGFYLITLSSTTASLDHLWVLPSEMRKGIGRSLLMHAERIAIEQGGQKMVIEADPHAEGFYQRLGASTVGYRDGTMDGIARCLPILQKSISSPPTSF